MAASNALKQLVLKVIRLKDETTAAENIADKARREFEDRRTTLRQCVAELCTEANKGVAEKDRNTYRVIRIEGKNYLLKIDPSTTYCEVGEVKVED